MLEVSNLSLPLGEDTVWSMTIGGEFVPLFRDSGVVVQTVVPLIFEDSSSTWPMVPADPVNVVLYRFDEPVDSLLGVFTIDSLPHASWAADSLIADLSSGAEAIRSTALSLGITDTIMLATYDALDEILYTGEHSLANILNGNSSLVPGDTMTRELFSALLVSSSYSDFFSTWSDSLNSIAITASSLKLSLSQADITDEGLAARMQLYSLINDFGNIAVGQTAITWQKVSAVIGMAGIAFPPISFFEFIVSFVVSELDFLINKLVVAAFPAEITRFDLDFANHQVNVGDTTEAIVYLSAKNNPPNITPMDIVLQVVNGIQLADWIRNTGIPRPIVQHFIQNAHDVIQDITTWYLGVVNNILSTNYNSPTQLDVSFPQWTWDSVRIENPELIDLMSPDLSKVGYMTGSFNGQAKDSIGPVGLQMRTQPPGPNTWIHPVLQSLGYAGGAFGNDLYTSNTDSVTIVPELVMEVDFANTISPVGANVLGINAGYKTSTGNSRWVPGIDISLVVTDGSASVTSGVTDVQGHFNSIITLDSGADSVVVHVFAYGEFNSQADTIVIAVSDSIASDTLGTGWGIRCLFFTGNYSRTYSLIDAGTSLTLAEIGGGSYYDAWCSDPHNLFEVFGPDNIDHSEGASCASSGARGGGTGSSSATLNIDHTIDADSSYRGFVASANCNASFSWHVDSVGWEMDGGAFGSTNTYVKIRVDSGYFSLTLNGTLRASNTDPTRNGETHLFSPNGSRYYVSETDDSLTINDTTALFPGNTYTITVSSFATGSAQDERDINSGSESGSAGFDIVCDIRRTPYPD